MVDITKANVDDLKSVDIVNRILDAFKNGKKDSAEFWIQSKGKFIHIHYFAIRDKTRKYQGTLEVTQDITKLKKLEGEQRLLSWQD
ncbi:MAG: PAS domain-containing protein [Candidatus Thorarchaeota archaeon]